MGVQGLDHHPTNLPCSSPLCTLHPPSGIRPQGSQAPTYHLPTCCLPASLTPPPSLTPIRDSASRVSSTWCWTRPTSCSTWTLSRQDTPHSCLTLFPLDMDFEQAGDASPLPHTLFAPAPFPPLLPHTLITPASHSSKSCLTLPTLILCSTWTLSRRSIRSSRSSRATGARSSSVPP